MKNEHPKIYVAGHRGLAGSAIVRQLLAHGYSNIVTRSHKDLDLTIASEVQSFLKNEKPDLIILAAAKVGGILANRDFPVDFLETNLAIQRNVILGAAESGIMRLIFLGSSCIYPRECPQPIREEYLLTGPLEPTNRPYAIAKIAGVELCESCNRQYGTQYLAVMPTNLYGPNDNYHPTHSHVIPGLIRRIHDAKERVEKVVKIWGSGKPFREFLFSEDFGEACLVVMSHIDSFLTNCRENDELPVINIGSGFELSIAELARDIGRVVGYKGRIEFDPAKPDGTPRKILDSHKLSAMGWKAKVGIEEGLKLTYEDYLSNQDQLRS